MEKKELKKRWEFATISAYTYDASYYINNDDSSYAIDGMEHKQNADDVMAELVKEFGESVEIVGVATDTFFGTPEYGSQLKGELAEYTIRYDDTARVIQTHLTSYGTNFDIRYGIALETKIDELWWQKQNLMYTTTGYGSKIPTIYKVFLFGKWRRVYTIIYSNSGSNYVIIDGQNVYLYDYNLER